MKKIIYLFIFISLANFSLSQISKIDSYKLNGKILDLDTKAALSGATIRLEGTGLGDVADNNGEFRINNLKPGKYKISINFVGYKSLTEEIDIFENKKDVIYYLKNKGVETSEIVISANKRIQSVQEVPVSIYIYTEDNKSNKNRVFTRIDDIFKLIPGVNLNKDNVNVRGSSGFAFGVGSRVLLLIDGFPMLSGDNGDMKFDAIPMMNIERIEVVKGAGSALYGSSALGGVINVITKDPGTHLDIDVKTYAGLYTEPRFESWKWSEKALLKEGFEMSLAKKIGNLGSTLSFGYINDDSYRKLDDSKRFFALSKFNYDFTNNFKAKLLINFSRDDKADWLYWRNLDSALIPPANTDMSARITSDKLNANLDCQYVINQDNFLSLKSGMYMTDFKAFSDLPDSNLRSSFANAINFELQYNNKFNNEFFITAGLTFLRNNVNSNIYGANNQSIYGGYTQLEYKPLNQLIINLGVRYDKQDVKGLESEASFSPKFGLTYLPLENLSLRSSIGSGFRSPKSAERFATLKAGGFDVVPNLNLKSEKSMSYEIGALYDLTKSNIPVTLDVSIFDNEFENLIEPTFVTKNGGAVIQFLNLTKARILGAEIDLKAMLIENLGIETALTLMEPKDLTLNETLKYRSKILWYNHIFYEWNNFGFNVDYRYMSRVETIDERLGLQVVDHDARVEAHITDLIINYNFKSLAGIDITTALFAKNLFDYYYTEMTGNLAQTRFIGIEIKYKY